MSACACGRPADTIGGLCERCAALQTLGLGTAASMAEVEGTYRTLVKVWHPDRFQTDVKLRKAAEDKLKEINAAHDFLVNGPPVEEPRFVSEEPEPTPEPEPEEEAEEIFEAPEPMDEDSPEVRRILRRQQRRSSRKILPRILFVAGGIAALAFLWVSLDLVLSSNQQTQRSWEEFKAEVARDVRSTFARFSSGSSEEQHGTPADNTPPPATPQNTEPARVPKPTVAAPAKSVSGAKPYITSGLTPTEVLGVLGNPTSSSGEKMLYGGSEIDFREGHVAGWKIDQKTPIRVKLWPDQPLTPGVRAYAVGSSKSDVIALQGTPTLFSENEFGYGGSRVYFKNDRVVSWKDDPSSVRLRVVAQ